MSKGKNKYWNPMIVGIVALILGLGLTDSYYEKYISNLSNDAPTVDAKGKIFYIILHYISNNIGKIGLQIIFIVIAFICFYIAYSLYKNQKQKKKNWKEYKESRMKKSDK